eukprot:TRINITY_DN1763_c2_g1_i1.p1 TRINITY_DN1763_c2_g1~~TRINITY_DN1763_c2_g1_i1.p1  ORF type:complete len:947 (+),score=248.97 TRINITY_DN1763_c2_g1_i1:44-2842(+)
MRDGADACGGGDRAERIARFAALIHTQQATITHLEEQAGRSRGGRDLHSNPSLSEALEVHRRQQGSPRFHSPSPSPSVSAHSHHRPSGAALTGSGSVLLSASLSSPMPQSRGVALSGHTRLLSADSARVCARALSVIDGERPGVLSAPMEAAADQFEHPAGVAEEMEGRERVSDGIGSTSSSSSSSGDSDDSDEGTFTVSVQLPTSAGTLALQIEATDTVADLKKVLETLSGVSTSAQRLYGEGRPLSDGDVVASSGAGPLQLAVAPGVVPLTSSVGAPRAAASDPARELTIPTYHPHQTLVTLLPCISEPSGTPGSGRPGGVHRDSVLDQTGSRRGWPFMWRPSTMTITTATTEGMTSECGSCGGSDPPPDCENPEQLPPALPAAAAQSVPQLVAASQRHRRSPPPPLDVGAPTPSMPPTATVSGSRRSGSRESGTDPSASWGSEEPPVLSFTSADVAQHQRGVVIGHAETFPATPLSSQQGATVLGATQTSVVPADCPGQEPQPARRGVAWRRGNTPPELPTDVGSESPRKSASATKMLMEPSVLSDMSVSAATTSFEDCRLAAHTMFRAEAAELWGTDSEAGEAVSESTPRSGPLVSAWSAGAKASPRDWPGGGRAPGDVFVIAWQTVPGSPQELPVCCCASAGRGAVRVFGLLGGREHSPINFPDVRTLAADGSRVIVGGGGQLHCYDLKLQKWLWKAQGDFWETVAAGNGRMVYGPRSGGLYLQRTRENPDGGRRVALEGSADVGRSWRCLAVDPPFVVAIDDENTLFVWSTSPPGSFVNSKVFGGKRPPPGSPRGKVTRMSLRSGVIATVHEKLGQEPRIHLWEAQTLRSLNYRSHSVGKRVTVELAGVPPHMLVAVADQESLRLFHLRNKSPEVKGDWAVPTGAGEGERLFFAGRTALVAVHKNAVVEWNPEALARGTSADCSVM